MNIISPWNGTELHHHPKNLFPNTYLHKFLTPCILPIFLTNILSWYLKYWRVMLLYVFKWQLEKTKWNEYHKLRGETGKLEMCGHGWHIWGNLLLLSINLWSCEEEQTLLVGTLQFSVFVHAIKLNPNRDSYLFLTFSLIPPPIKIIKFTHWEMHNYLLVQSQYLKVLILYFYVKCLSIILLMLLIKISKF